jgi:hypothetical protein
VKKAMRDGQEDSAVLAQLRSKATAGGFAATGNL